jgi:DNA-binding MarR family transcriptional regulator
MPPGFNLTAIDRVLIHLKDHLHHADGAEFPFEITQKGISDATGIRLEHVPRTLKTLEDRGLVSSAKGHVRMESRRYKVYFLTGKGLEEAGVVLGRALRQEAEPGRTAEEVLGGRKGAMLPMLRELAGEEQRHSCQRRVMAGPVPGTVGFVNRARELEQLAEMLDSPKMRFIIIYASLGYGASALAARLVTGQSADWSVAWVDVGKGLPGMRERLEATLGGLGVGTDGSADSPRALAEALSGRGILLVLDNYYDVAEETVEYLAGLVSASRSAGNLKVLVTAREDTPPYNRFYTIMDLHDGTVGEVHIHGLDAEHCRELLGTPDIDPDALNRLFLFTRGKPPTLRLLAEGDERSLKQQTSFSTEEIKLMLFLKGQRKK